MENKENSNLKKITAFLNGVEIKVPFTKYPPAPANIIVLDTESTEDNLITVFGYYTWGNTHFSQIFFEKPVPPESLAKTNVFQALLIGNQFAIYNSQYESRLFHPYLPKEKLIELAPFTYVARQDFFQLATLDKVSSKFLLPWVKSNYGSVLFHNYSCLCHACLILLGAGTYGFHNFRTTYKREVVKYIK